MPEGRADQTRARPAWPLGFCGPHPALGSALAGRGGVQPSGTAPRAFTQGVPTLGGGLGPSTTGGGTEWPRWNG